MDPAPRTYLVECYVPGIDKRTIEAAAERARAAALALRGEGVDVQYVNAILVPDDDVVFHVFSGQGPEMVAEASLRAEIPFERIVESVAVADPPIAPIADGQGAGV